MTVLAYDGPMPVPADWTPRLHGSTFDLSCKYCGFAPRPGDDGLRSLVEMAAARGGTLDINPARP